MTRATLKNIETELELYGINKDHMLNPNRRVQWIVRCRGVDCPTPPLHKHWGPMIPPEVMIKDVRRAGWLIDRGERPLCPACQKRISRKAKDIETGTRRLKPKGIETWAIPKEDIDAAQREISAMLQEANAKLPEDMKFKDDIAVADPVITKIMDEVREVAEVAAEAVIKKPEPNLRITRAVFDALDENFEITNTSVSGDRVGRYRNGMDDGSIARMVGCAQGVVENIRLTMYGEIAEDARVSVIRDDLARLERTFDRTVKTAKDEIAALRSRIEQVAAMTGKGK